MNSRYENNSQKNFSVQELINKNSSNLGKLSQQTYQVEICSIPKEQRSIEIQLMKDMVEFQPKLHELISELATSDIIAENQADLMNQLLQELAKMTNYIQNKHTETVKDVENALKQDGKMRENFISEFSSEMRTNLEALEEATDMLKKHLLKLLAITIGAATFFSTLVSVLLQLWLR